jgi:hypothetical protein
MEKKILDLFNSGGRKNTKKLAKKLSMFSRFSRMIKFLCLLFQEMPA